MKKKIFVFLFCFLFMPSSLLIINIIIDPMLKFGTNVIDRTFSASLEREQKTNLIYRTAKNYDSILFGSSRATFINQNNFLNMKVFNYAVSSERLSEFKPYLDFFRDLKDKEPKNIILGLDFYHTNGFIDDDFSNFQRPEYYIRQTRSFEYLFSLIFSSDLLKSSIKSISKTSYEEPYYDNSFIKFQNKVSEKTRLERYQSNIKGHLKANFGDKYFWNSKVFDEYREIKESYPNSKIIAFTQPITSELFATYMKKAGHFENYKKWIKGLVEIYGEIYCFMGINNITTNLENYPDDDHYYPEIGKIIAYKLSTMDFDSEPKDFGVIVNKNNVDEFLEFQAKQLENYEFSEFYPHDEIDKIINEVK